jgi:hypothetical protein
MTETDGVQPEPPESEGLRQPELPDADIEPARLLANEARARLEGEGFDDDEIDAWTRVYYERRGEGDVEGLLAFIRSEQASGRRPEPGQM